MRIKWMNNEHTEAEVTNGWLWWKRIAYVRRAQYDRVSKYRGYNHLHVTAWKHLSTERYLSFEGCKALEDLRDALHEESKQAKEWLKPTKLPKAKALPPRA